MKSSSYLNWFRRLVILGAVVAAGAFAATAGAVGRPPDIQDTAANLGANVSRPPDVTDAAAATRLAVTDVFERYAAEHPYGRGLTLTATTLVTRPPDVKDTATTLNALSNSAIVSRPPDVQDTAASVNAASPSGSTLVSRPPDVTDTALALQTNSSTQSNGFNWSDWGIGIGTGMGLALLLGVVFVMSRQLRNRVQPA